jgi:hypothetical protein
MSITIPLNNATTREAVTATPTKEFAQAYILDLVVNAKTASGNDHVRINYCPYDKESGERLLEDTRTISIPFWQTVAAVPDALAAFEAVGAAQPAMIEYQEHLAEESLALSEAGAEAPEEF